MPGGVGGQRRKPLPTRLEKQNYEWFKFPVGDKLSMLDENRKNK
jgi:hypothetical protein